jgi:hypothetical protein
MREMWRNGKKGMGTLILIRICSVYTLVACCLFACVSSSVDAACSWSGNTGTVASPYAAADLNACVTDASGKTGEVFIQIPNSSSTHTGTVTVNMMSGFDNVTMLTIRGQNDCILDTSEIATGIPISCGTNIANMILYYTGHASKKFRFAHIRLTGAPSENGITIDGESAYPNGGWRIDHVFFDTVNPSSRIVWFERSGNYGLSNGVIDHCYVLNPTKIFFQYQPQMVDGGNREWMAPLGLGTVDAIYIEDSKFYLTTGNTSAPFLESQGGGRFVFRYNIVHNGYLDAHDAIVTGLRGTRKYEVYNNTFSYDANTTWVTPVGPRGGAGVVFNNTISDPTYSISSEMPCFAIYRYSSAISQNAGDPWENAPNDSSPTYTKATLDTVATNPHSCSTGIGCITIDGSGAGGYPARDQLGVDGNNPQVAGAAPFLVWNNKYNGSPTPPVIIPGYGDAYMINGVDYCYHATTKPATCNGITTAYTPYTYPHPLAGGTTPPEPSPTPAPSDGGAGGGCFIATAAFGSPLEPHVTILRSFRDRLLLNNPAGKAFVELYYHSSPPIADFIARHDSLKMLIQFILLPVVGFCWLCLTYGPLGTMLLITSFIVLGLFSRRLYIDKCAGVV